jgi:hypothetical protein
MKQSPLDYFSNYKDPRILQFIQDKGISAEPQEWYDNDYISKWYLNTIRHNATEYTETVIIPKLKKQRKEKTRKLAKYLVFRGKHGYDWLSVVYSMESVPGRVGQRNTLLNTVADSLWEYYVYTMDSFSSAEVDFLTEKEVTGLTNFRNVENVLAINVSDTFWKERNL